MEKRLTLPSNLRRVVIPIRNDTVFFESILSNILRVRTFLIQEKKSIIHALRRLGQDICKVSSPLQSSEETKIWQVILTEYSNAGIFRIVSEESSVMPSASNAELKLTGFRDNISKLVSSSTWLSKEKLRNPRSKAVLEEFWKINESILAMRKFQEYNWVSLKELLEEFERYTGLKYVGAVKCSLYCLFLMCYLWSRIRQPLSDFLSESILDKNAIIHEIWSTILTNVIDCIPKLDDYLCPVCSDITVKPSGFLLNPHSCCA